MALLTQTLALLAMAVATTGIEVETLDMAQDSFDDQYQGCGPDMAAALPALNRSEFEQNPLFAQAWTKARAEWQSRGSPVSPLSSPAQAIALMAYTMNDLYREFNAAVRTAGQEYRDNFHFKTLHFLLTQALATLRVTQGPKCQDVYRGVRGVRFQAGYGDVVRFGQFTSASQSETASQKFGRDTMFQVHTCHGAEIREFSKYPGEKEVLIPPFETFEVIKVSQEGERARIQLRSKGTFSKYNCEWLQGGSAPRAPFHVGGLLLATTALAVAIGIL
uniref:NAD(P)(+)--arginine ADP-ribosyltransferase 2-like n=1 Tax=Agelaius phoeniceus TaxID=39638 RepID=UPI0023EB5738|nr:NAD(P)(+)--arginine ADP-ribosyltransferase 2-like [Agelaius phoeniceus]